VKRAATLAIALAIVACGGKSAPPPQPTEEETPVTGFAWSPPCRVPVLEHNLAHGGNRFVWAYLVNVDSRGDGNLVVDLVDIDLREVNGHDATRPEDADRASLMERMLEAFPAMIVDREGAYLESEGFDEILERLIAVSPNPSVQRMIRETPAMHTPFRRQFGELWQAWVGHWIDWSIEPGADATIVETIPGPDGEAVPYRVVRSHLGVENGYARLRVVETHRGDAIKTMMLPVLVGLADQVADPAGFVELLKSFDVDGQVEISFEVETELATLRPRRGVLDKRMEFGFLGNSTNERSTREFTFDWERAIGCGE